MTFRVDIDRLVHELRKITGRLFQNEPPHRGQITVEVDGADERFERVGQG